MNRWTHTKKIFQGLLLASLLLGVYGCKKDAPPPPPLVQPPRPTNNSGGGVGGGGSCGNIGRTTQRLTEIPLEIQLGQSSNNKLSRLVLFISDVFNVNEPYYPIVGSGQLLYGDIRSFPQYNNQQITFCVSSTNAADNTPLQGAYYPQSRQIELTLVSKINSVVAFQPNGQPIQGQETVTVEIGTRQGYPAYWTQVGIEGHAVITVGNNPSYLYQLVNTGSGGGFPRF